MDINQRANAVRTRDDFVAFVQALREDLMVNDSEAWESPWENPTLERFLEAMARWIKDKRGTYPPDEMGWQDLAAILMAARIYE